MGSPLFRSIREAAPTLSVGMLTADLGHLADEMRLLESTGVRLVHFDVMDGCFCPMTSLGPPVVKAVRTSLVKDVHLMIVDPLTKLRDYVAAGADVVTVHVESGEHVHRVLQELGSLTNANDPERGIVRGVALNPGTPLETLEPLLDELELILLLAVNPGWGGQTFATATPRRLERARRMIEDTGHEILLGVDGGITRQNLGDVVGLGPDVIVTGSAIFDGKAPADNAKAMLESVAAAAGKA
jgi:ribulose-phosphate 3-epimerase